MADNNDKDDVTGTETTGHEWDGIKELNTPLPRWWLWTFYLTVIWGIGYVIAYPAWPLVNGATQGVLGFSTRENVAQEIALYQQRNAEVARGTRQCRSLRGGTRHADPRLRDRGRGGGLPQPLLAMPRLRCGGRGGVSQPARRCLALGGRGRGDRLHRPSRHSQRNRPRRPLVADAGLWRDLRGRGDRGRPRIT